MDGCQLSVLRKEYLYFDVVSVPCSCLLPSCCPEPIIWGGCLVGEVISLRGLGLVGGIAHDCIFFSMEWESVSGGKKLKSKV